jgi:hypothetical protein
VVLTGRLERSLRSGAWEGLLVVGGEPKHWREPSSEVKAVDLKQSGTAAWRGPVRRDDWRPCPRGLTDNRSAALSLSTAERSTISQVGDGLLEQSRGPRKTYFRCSGAQIPCYGKTNLRFGIAAIRQNMSDGNAFSVPFRQYIGGGQEKKFPVLSLLNREIRETGIRVPPVQKLGGGGTARNQARRCLAGVRRRRAYPWCSSVVVRQSRLRAGRKPRAGPRQSWGADGYPPPRPRRIHHLYGR